MTIWQQPATELARLLRARQLSAREVVLAHLERIQQVNSRVNAIVTLAPEAALAAARRADARLAHGEPVGPLHGLPIAHKDLHATAGIRTTFGSPLYRDHVPAVNAPIVQRLHEAGAIVIGKTNTPEFGAGSQTFNPVFGATVNPYDTTLTCGGSSGGAAVALACGMLPIADGTDMGGSLRNPSAFCGVVGMRPSAYRMPGADVSSSWASLSVDGPMARSVADVALLLGAMTETAPPVLDRDFTRTRVAWVGDVPGMPFERRVREVVDRSRPWFEAIGCTVEEASPDFSGADEAFRMLRARAFAAKHGALTAAERAIVKPAIRDEIERGEQLSAADVARAELLRASFRQRTQAFMDRYEFFILPTTQVAPFNVTQEYVRAIDGEPLATYIDWMKSCYFISVLGHPALSVPCGLTSGGLPVGVQIVGRDRADDSVLQLAHAFERANTRACRMEPDALPARCSSVARVAYDMPSR
ncbi:MAG: amidase [Acidobacteriaceae bacterium]|nr:amidase [Acidobacteriaceae bacterium]